MKDSYFRIIDNQLASVTLMPFMSRGVIYAWAVTEVAVKPRLRGKGLASELMREVLADADRESVTLILEILADPGGLTPEQLEAWYKRLGFIWNDEGFMERKPR